MFTLSGGFAKQEEKRQEKIRHLEQKKIAKEIQEKNELIRQENAKIVRQKTKLKLEVFLDEITEEIRGLGKESETGDILRALQANLQIIESDIRQGKRGNLAKFSSMKEQLPDGEIKDKMLVYLILAAFSSNQLKFLKLLTEEEQSTADKLGNDLWKTCTSCDGSGKKKCRVCKGSGTCQICRGSGRKRSSSPYQKRRVVSSEDDSSSTVWMKRYERGGTTEIPPEIDVPCPPNCTHCQDGYVKCMNCFGYGKLIKKDKAKSQRLKVYQQLITLLQKEQDKPVAERQAMKSRKEILIQRRNLIQQKIKDLDDGKDVDFAGLDDSDEPGEAEDAEKTKEEGAEPADTEQPGDDAEESPKEESES